MPLTRSLSRRTLLASGAAAYLSHGRSRGGWAASYPFTLGVASGNPTPGGCVLWTRLAPEPLSPDPTRPGGMPPEVVAVRWEVAEDPAMQRIVRTGSAEAAAAFAHSVHIECTGLYPDRPYWYRFIAAGEASPIGYTRTAPARRADAERLRFGFVSCAHYERGFYSAYRHLAAEFPDLVVFLGDYIYESLAPANTRVRQHSDGVEAIDLRTYRNRHAQYKTDADLQAVHAAAPCLAIWDDHEVQNDYAAGWSMTFDDPAAFLKRRAAAYRAFWEHMPLPQSALPQGPDATIYGRCDFGTLATFLFVDGRQYRSRLACDTPPRGGAKQIFDSSCPERLDPTRSLLGTAQEEWLFAQFRAAPARWNILAQDVLMAEFKERVEGDAIAHWSDDWNGYPAARRRLLQQAHDSRLSNPVVLTGDIHSFWANDLKLDFDDPNAPIVASEFVGTSISSPGPPHAKFTAWAADNPHVRFFDSRKRGYASVELQRDRMTVAFRAVSDVKDPSASVSTLKSFVVESGKAGPVPA